MSNGNSFGPCPSCGDEIYLRLERCPFCRADLTGSPVESPAADPKPEPEAAKPESALVPLPVGEVHVATVRTITEFGAFVTINDQEAFLPVDAFPGPGSTPIEELLDVGDRIRVVVEEIEGHGRVIVRIPASSVSIRTEAQTVEDAVLRALEHLDRDEDEVTFEVLQEPTSGRGKWGVGRRNAIVRVTPIDP